MDILWAASGICAIVFFAFFILAQHWRKVIREQSRSLRRLSDRLRDMQEIVDPEFRKRINEFSPMPLDQVLHVTFHLADRFWRDRLKIDSEMWKIVQSLGTVLGSVKLEVWRSHTVATVLELLPETKAAGWHTRVVDFYPSAAGRHDHAILWELRLAVPKNAAERVPTLELILRRGFLDLRLSSPAQPKSDVRGHELDETTEPVEEVLLVVPLDHDALTKYRTRDPAHLVDEAHPPTQGLLHGSAWQAFYAHTDEEAGIAWQLRLLDLSKKAQWERWKILEGPIISYGGYGN